MEKEGGERATKTFLNVLSVLNSKGRIVHFILKGQAAKWLYPKQTQTNVISIKGRTFYTAAT